MCKIIINNSECEIHDIPKHINSLLWDELSYENQSVRFTLNKTLKSLRDINLILSAPSKFKSDPTSLLKQKRRLQYIRESQEENLTTRLYGFNKFPTGLLPRVLEILDENDIVYVHEDLRKKPALLKEKYVLRESFPPLRYYQKEAAAQVMKKHRGIIESPTGSGKSL